MRRPTTLYRYFDRRGILLYVGITKSGHSRALAHWKNAKWWRKVSTATFEHFPDEASALLAEERAIWHEMPIYNHAGAGRGNIWAPTSLTAWERWQDEHPRRMAISSEELAVIVRLHPTVVNELLKKRGLPHKRIGRTRLIPVQFVEAVIDGLTMGKPV